MLLLPLGCGGSGGGGQSAPTQIQFAARVNGQAANCQNSYEGVGVANTRVQLQDFRFFISNLRLVTTGGEEVPVELVEDGLWQVDNLALLDFEDASGACSELGTPATNTVVNFSAPARDYIGVRFELGVPFHLNHQDASTAPAPLNLGAMQWNWQAGYKFIRVDLLNENQAPGNRWFVHLGSTGCQSASSVTAPTTECARPNRVEVALDGFIPGESQIVIDIGQFLRGSNVGQNTPETLPGCMSGLTDPECPELFRAFGLNTETGVMDCENCQELFTLE